jgi:hypothetical protein
MKRHPNSPASAQQVSCHARNHPKSTLKPLKNLRNCLIGWSSFDPAESADRQMIALSRHQPSTFH